MKLRNCILFLSLLAGGSAHAATTGYAACGTYTSYVMFYKDADGYEELGKLRCGEKVEILTRWVEYFQIRTIDGRIGWVHYAEISNTPPQVQGSTNFGLTDSARARADVVPSLTNANILKMHTMKLGADVIVAKIQGSPCEFDTSPAALQKLKTAGLPDKVILAMVTAPLASAPPAPKVPEIIEVKIPSGTKIQMALNLNFSSADAREGQIVLMTVAEDVVINGVKAIQKGSEAHARVIEVKQPAFMNRPPGSISWSMDYVTAVTGEHIPVNFFSTETTTNPTSGFMGAAGPSWEFHKGKPVVVTAGQRFEAVVHNNAVLRIPPALAATLAASQAQGGSSGSASAADGAANQPIPQAPAQPAAKP
jgi:SH3 domain-containing protein